MDGTTAELIKAGDEEMMVLVSASPRKEICDNWRPMTLISIPRIVYCQVILSRMRGVVVGEQASFRPIKYSQFHRHHQSIRRHPQTLHVDNLNLA